MKLPFEIRFMIINVVLRSHRQLPENPSEEGRKRCTATRLDYIEHDEGVFQEDAAPSHQTVSVYS